MTRYLLVDPKIGKNGVEDFTVLCESEDDAGLKCFDAWSELLESDSQPVRHVALLLDVWQVLEPSSPHPIDAVPWPRNIHDLLSKVRQEASSR